MQFAQQGIILSNIKPFGLEYKIPSVFEPYFREYPGGPVARLFRDSDAQVYHTNYDFGFVEAAITGSECYVDLENGSNANNGSSGAPFKTMAYAISQSFNIYNVRGKGNLTESLFTLGSKNVRIRRWGSTNPQLRCSPNTPFSWSLSSGSMYQATNTETPFVNNVYDETNVDSKGCYVGLFRRTSSALVAANPNSFYYDSATTTLYVHTFDSRPADSSIIPCIGSGGGNRIICSVTGTINANRYMLFEDIDFLGGTNSIAIGGAGTGTVYFGVERCKLNNSTGADASFYMTRPAVGFLRHCLCRYNRTDGFDSSQDGAAGLLFEWYCDAGYNVWDGTANNGSTFHADSLGIRVGGTYEYTMGKCVQDIDNVYSYNIGLTAGYAQAANPNDYPYASNSLTDGSFTTMWLIECKGTGPAGKGYRNFDNSEMNIFDGPFGNIQSLTNLEDSGSVTNILTSADVYV